jgi:flagellar motor protein MotB
VLPPKRYPRVERELPVEVYEDENSHLWAVSYADFLMALLSFFILFFSIDEKSHDQFFIQLAKEFSIEAPSEKNGTGRGLTSTSKSMPDIQKSTSLQQALQSLNLKTTVEKNRLVVDFPQDFFLNGEYSIGQENKVFFNQVLKKIEPFKQDLKIYFEGHTDDKPSRKKVENLVVDNFLLSSLRASTALFLAKEIGFTEEQMYIQAASSHKRNTRSISMHLIMGDEVRK